MHFGAEFRERYARLRIVRCVSTESRKTPDWLAGAPGFEPGVTVLRRDQCPATGRLDYAAKLKPIRPDSPNATLKNGVAHEIGHHVQNLLGIAEQVEAAK